MVSIAQASIPLWGIQKARSSWSAPNLLRIVAAGARRSSSHGVRVETQKQRRVDLDDEFDEGAALEALFSQLEQDLADEKAGKKVEIEVPSEEQLAALEKELMRSTRKKKKTLKAAGSDEHDEEAETEEEESEVELDSGLARFIEDVERMESERVTKRIVQLQRWQLKKLKNALDVDKKKLQVKALAGETGLDRKDVLSFLRNPPAELLELIESLSDGEEDDEVVKNKEVEAQEKAERAMKLKEEKQAKLERQKQKAKAPRLGSAGDLTGNDPASWYGRKRIRKVHLETFEVVYRRTQRPSREMLQSIVDLTRVPKKRVMEWFETRRQEDAARRSELREKALVSQAK